VSYKVIVLRKAQKNLEAIPSPAFDQIEAKLLALAENPRPHGCKKLRDRERAWRIRSGDYRIVYDIDDSTSIVTVVRIGHRREIYR
jgi:mRNA interferase RelE/StbE